MVLLEAVPPGEDWQEAERFWIASFRSVGVSLTNLAKGGEGTSGVHHTERSKQLLSEKLRGRKKPRDAVERGAAKRRGQKRAQPTLDRMSRSLLGKRRTPEQRAQMAIERRQRKIATRNSSGYRGVIYSKSAYQAQLLGGARERSYIGRYATAIEAAVAYDTVARVEFGVDAALNFPFPGEKSARPGVEPREWAGLPAVKIGDEREPLVSQRDRSLRSKKRNKHGFRGVKQVKGGRFEARCGDRYVGTAPTAEEAARMYDRAARERYGDKAPLNFPDSK